MSAARKIARGVKRRVKPLWLDAKARSLAASGRALAAISPQLHRRYVRALVQGPYRGSIVQNILGHVEALEGGADATTTLTAITRDVRSAMERGEFDHWLNVPVTSDARFALIECRDYLPGRRWKLQLFYIPENHSHAPHSHTDVSSCLVVARGSIHAREFNRHHDRKTDPSFVMLERSSDRVLTAGETLITSRVQNDVHWFGAVDGPAIAFNFQAVGFTKSNGKVRDLRVYVDPTSPSDATVFAAPKMQTAEAHGKFNKLPLSAFPA